MENWAWWNSSWDYATNITFTNITANQTNITLDTYTLNNTGKLKGDCTDIRFVNDTTTVDYWIESCSLTNGVNGTIWINTTNYGANFSLYMYYGNTEAANMSNVSKVFYTDIATLVGSWNFDEGNSRDRSGYENNGTPNVNVSYWTTNCKFGNCVNITTASGIIETTNDSSLQLDRNFTATSWYFIPTIGTPPTYYLAFIISKGWINEYDMWDDHKTGYATIYRNSTAKQKNGLAPATGTWAFVTWMANGAGTIYYIKNASTTWSNLGNVSGTNSTCPLHLFNRADCGDVTKYETAGSLYDETNVFSSSLTQAQISFIYNYSTYSTPNYKRHA